MGVQLSCSFVVQSVGLPEFVELTSIVVLLSRGWVPVDDVKSFHQISFSKVICL